MASAPGGMGLPQLEHVTRVIAVVLSTIQGFSRFRVTYLVVNAALPYIFYGVLKDLLLGLLSLP
ncbi:MAG: hypothetical protein QXY07_00220 [Candidatus Bathyarchaeia archaeon]